MKPQINLWICPLTGKTRQDGIFISFVRPEGRALLDKKCMESFRNQTAMRIALCCHVILVLYAQKILENRLSTTHLCFD